jgi:hypothetical protein
MKHFMQMKNVILAGLLMGAAHGLTVPVQAHPRSHMYSSEYSYPQPNVMVRKNWKECKKIRYETKYDRWGWYTERKVLPLKECYGPRRKPNIHVDVFVR